MLQRFLHLLSALVLLLPASALLAQLPQAAEGSVIDKRTAEPLTGAHVVFENHENFFGCLTDAAGNFKIENIPPGKYEVKISFIGYQPLVMPEVMNWANPPRPSGTPRAA